MLSIDSEVMMYLVVFWTKKVADVCGFSTRNSAADTIPREKGIEVTEFHQGFGDILVQVF